MKLSEIETLWDSHKIDEPEIHIDSIYPRDQKRPVSNAYVAGRVAGIIANDRAKLDGGRSRVLEFMRMNDIAEIEMSPVQKITHDELFDLLLGATLREPRVGSEQTMARRASTRIFAKFFPETFMMAGWIGGTHVRHAGDVFELTGTACSQCLVNPEAYGHGGGIRCLDVKNCGYWYCA